MNTAQDHYEQLLAQHYTWMFGAPFEHIVQSQSAVLQDAGVGPPGTAIDLGCGSGFQSLALADMGATRVYAVDTSAALLSELTARAEHRPIITLQADLADFDAIIAEPADTVVCMGDTLTHLPAKEDVIALFANAAARLRAGGRLVLSWRDLSAPAAGLDRFIPIRSTNDKHMLCFLEDRGDTVLVHDLVHALGAEGWEFQKSAYAKLKLAPDWVRERLHAAGLTPDYHQTIRGMTVMAARA